MSTIAALTASATPALDCRANHITSPSQWTACFKQGMHQPTTGAYQAGYTVGHNIVWILLAAVIIIVLIKLAGRSKSGSPAASKS